MFQMSCTPCAADSGDDDTIPAHHGACAAHPRDESHLTETSDEDEGSEGRSLPAMVESTVSYHHVIKTHALN